MVVLVTFDNEQFVVDREVAERSAFIKKILEGKKCSLPPLPLYLTTLFVSRSWRRRPAYSITSGFFVCANKGSFLFRKLEWDAD